MSTFLTSLACALPFQEVAVQLSVQHSALALPAKPEKHWWDESPAAVVLCMYAYTRGPACFPDSYNLACLAACLLNNMHTQQVPWGFDKALGVLSRAVMLQPSHVRSWCGKCPCLLLSTFVGRPAEVMLEEFIQHLLRQEDAHRRLSLALQVSQGVLGAF